MLYLFSSNSQPQYAQDILNVLAAPPGYRMTFRYDARYVDAPARASWGHLAGNDILIHFVLQQAHEYFLPVLFPVCKGKVVQARSEGDIHLIDFIVGDVVSLRAPETPQGHARRTAAYRELLEGDNLPLPYDKYAILSDYDVTADNNAAGVICSDQPVPNQHSVPEIFRLTTDYLANTETFTSARFAYVARLFHRGQTGAERIDTTSSAYKLTSGHEYELEFLQAQPKQVITTSVLKVVLDGVALQAIGPSELSIGSPYDVQSIRMVALPPTASVKYTTIGLRPGDGVQGPSLDIPVEIRRPVGTTVGVALGTAVSVVLLGLSSILTEFTGLEKGALVATATVIASLLSAFRWSTKSL